ncbi:phosphotransferase family protein [Gordoniibacillus kamchatkensis]|uniref:phosphotransferase family protein n=1 Tax=Gordoniibacillus kamchatkensis TaxID=1590651 RepID=UPI001E5C626A|nr:aminoglycoside phosphotransferase family protein [Paenibacillus sp. VKM B-2647]
MIVSQIARDVFGTEPLKLERMTIGRMNVVYSVALPEREVIVRMNENPFVLKGTSRNIAVLARMGLPVPKVIAEDLTKERYPFHFIVLGKMPGRDLGLELPNMTREQVTRLAEAIVSYQRQMANLPLGSGYGWVPIGDKGEFASWTDIVCRDFNSGLPNAQKELAPAEIERIEKRLERLAPYLDQVRPVCFLDDVTTKNVMILNGELQGIVDLDCVCYGDPLYMISLTQTAICADIGQADLFYIDELCRVWGLADEQRQIVDFYSLLFAMTFLGYFGDDVSGYRRMLSHIKRWTAALDR